MAYAGSLTGLAVYEDAVWAGRQSWAWMPIPRSLDLGVRVLIGPGAFIGRTVSLAWHLLNGLLLSLLARRVLSTVGALCAVGLFWLHPIQTEAVAYMASRGELITATWVLLALLALEARWVWLAIACAVCAITGKEMGVVAVPLIGLWAWHRRQAWTAMQIGVYAVVIGLSVALVIQYSPVRPWAGGWYVAGQLAAIGRLLLLWPEALIHPSALSIEHDWIWITRGTAGAAVAIWIAAVALSRGWVRFALLWSVVAVWPRLVLPLLDGQHERHLYLASLAICLAIGAAVGHERTTRAVV